MKRYIKYFVLACLLAMAACVSEQEIDLALDTDLIEIGPEGGIKTLKLSVGEDWVAMTNEPWITFSPANGKGSEDCRVIIDSTLLKENREDVVRITTASGKNKEFTVKQGGFEEQINIKKSSVEVKDFDVLEKRKFEIVVNTNVEFEVEIPEDQSWLSYEQSDLVLDRGARPRNSTVVFEWKVNPTRDSRKAEVKFRAKDGGQVSSVLTVSQTNAPDIDSHKNTPAGDSLALLSINRFLGCWTEFDTSLPMNRWEGVTVYETGVNKGRVKSAQFIFFDTKESLPFAVKYLTAADELYFFSNVNSFRKSLSIGDDICELENLRRLTVFGYGLTELSDNFSNMKNLRYLDLGANNFEKIPEVLRECTNLKALFLTSNQRSVVSDLSNTVKKDLGGLMQECPADAAGNRKFPQWILEWSQLDTLRLSVNYLQGTLPSDEELLEAGFKAWDPDTFDPAVTEVNIADSLGTDGVKYFKDNLIPMVLPDTDFLAINLNRLHGAIPKWLKFHPKLDYWAPLLLVFPQEGTTQEGIKAGFTDEPTNLNYYYEIYSKKKYSDIYDNE